MNDKFSLPSNRELLADLIRENSALFKPGEADIKRAWSKLNQAIEGRKRGFRPALYSLGGIALAASLIIIFIFLVQGSLNNRNSRYLTRITRFNSGLSIERGNKKIIVENSLSVKAGDIIENNSGSKASLNSEGNFQTVLKPGTRAFFKSIAVNGFLKPEILLEKGGMDFHVKSLDKGESFDVESSGLRISIVGTVFGVSRSEKGLMIAVKKGKVTVFREAGELKLYDIPAGREVFIPAGGEAVSNSLDKSSSEELEMIEENTPSSNNAFVSIKTPGEPATIYINGRESGKPPMGLDILKNSELKIEAVGDNGVVERFGDLRLRDNESMTIDLSEASHPLYSSLSGMGPEPRMNFSPGIIAVSGGVRGFIYNIDNGKIIDLPSSYGEWKLSRIIGGNRTLMVNSQGSAVCFGPGGRAEWTLSIPGTLWYGTEITSGDNYIVLSTMDKGIYIFSLHGKMIDHIDTEIAGPGFSSPVLDRHGVLYFTGEFGKLTAYSIDSGRTLWQVALKSVSAHPLMESGQAITVYFRDSGSLASYSKQDGSLLWTSSLGDAAFRDAKIAARQNIIAVFFNSGGRGRASLIDQNNGRELGDIMTKTKITSVLPSSDKIWVATDDLILSGYDVPSLKKDGLFHLGSRALQMDGWKGGIWVLCEKGVDSIKPGIEK